MMRCTNPILTVFLGSMFMLTQACDQSPAGEKIAAKPDPGQNIVKVDVKKDEPVPEPSVDEEPTPGEIAPELPPPPSGRPGDEIPNNGPGYGGGSQGALQPIPTGDEDDDEDDDFGVCGNGEQEVLRNTNKNCPHLLYGTTIAENSIAIGMPGASTLVYFNVETGQGFNIATISGLTNVSAIDFSPEGFLYGVGIASSGRFNGQSVFAQIDCQTGVATIIGPTEISSVPSNIDGSSALITDINFDSQGQLWAFLTNQHYAGTINFATGLFTPISTLPIAGNTQGFGLVFFPFPNDQLYLAGNNNLVLINESNGTGAIASPLSFPSLISPFINAMDNDPLNNILYVSIASDTQNNLGILDIITGNVSLIGTTPVPAPDGLDGLAINRRYEECDTQAVGTTACIDCELHEVDCADGIDDDFDGLIDCDDPDCLDRPCDDGDACTLDDTCTAFTNDENSIVVVCTGVDEVCNDENPCTFDRCCNQFVDAEMPHFCPVTVPPVAPGTCLFLNNLSLENQLGSCEEDGRACTVGKCTLPPPTDPPTPNPTFICFETDRKFVPIETAVDVPNFGCLDDNQCTADSCVESWTKEGFDSNGNVIGFAAVPWGSTENVDNNGNVILDNDWHCESEVMPERPCIDPNTCRDGTCTITGTGMSGDPSTIECVPEAPRSCDSDSDCNAGLEICIDEICTLIDNGICSKRVFVTNGVRQGNFGGIAAANQLCQTEGSVFFPGRTFAAWVSDSTGSPSTNFIKSTIPYRLPDGSLVANNYTDLITLKGSNYLRHAIDQHANGTLETTILQIWTGTTPSGTADLPNCSNWTSSLFPVVGIAGLDFDTNALWTSTNTASCSFGLPFYCFEQ